MYTPQGHTFAVCAMARALSRRVHSLAQRADSFLRIFFLATSTPNELIQSLCEKYNIPYMHVNPGPRHCWRLNFAVSYCNNPLVTIAHQDDIYKPFMHTCLECCECDLSPADFTNYGELRDGEEYS